MKPGDLVTTVIGHEAFRKLHGVIVKPVTPEDGIIINSWCDWWVLINGELQAWAEEFLQVIDEAQ